MTDDDLARAQATGAGRVFVLGASRTGTMSLHHHFAANGLRSIHFYEAEANQPDTPLWPDKQREFVHFLRTTDHQAFSDYPTRTFFHVLPEVQPEARFILTVRRSTAVWRASMQAVMPGFGQGGLDLDALCAEYETLNRSIEELFAPLRFLRLVIDAPDQEKQAALAAFMDWPEAELPHVHSKYDRSFRLAHHAGSAASAYLGAELVACPGARHPAIWTTRSALGTDRPAVEALPGEDGAVLSERVPARAQILRAALRELGVSLQGELSALVLGCGDGDFAFAVLRLFNDAHVVAVDARLHRLEILAARAATRTRLPQLTIVRSDAGALQLVPGAFDLVVVASRPEDDAGAAVSGLLGCLRPGGAVIFVEGAAPASDIDLADRWIERPADGVLAWRRRDDDAA